MGDEPVLPVYPFRPLLFRPISRLGVNLEDWPLLLGGTFLAYTVGFLTGWRWQGFPIAPFPAAIVFAGLVGFFNWARLGRPRLFLRHWLLYRIRPRRLAPAWFPPARGFVRRATGNLAGRNRGSE